MKIPSTKMFMQKDDYSCTACVLRFALQCMKGKTISKEKAAEITKSKPHGTSFVRLQKVFRQYGFKTTDLKIDSQKIRSALKDGKLVVIDDIYTHDEDPHAILIYAYKDRKFNIFDSFVKPYGKRIETARTIIKNATEGFVLSNLNS